MRHHHHMNTKEFVVGAAVGSLLGSVAALLIAPQSGKELREGICDTYCNISDKTQDFANRGRSFAKNMGCQTCDWASKARSAVDGARKTMKGWISEEEEEEETSRDLIIGGLVGAVLGAAIGLLLAPKPGEELRQDLADRYEDYSDRTHEFANDIGKRGRSFAKNASKKANKWLNLAQELVDDLSENVPDSSRDLFERAKGLINNNRVHDVMDWASLGYRLWQGVKSKR